jgi:hypothetical protein
MGEGGGEVGMFLDMLSTEMAKGRDFEVLQAYLAAFLRIHEVALIGHEGLQVCTAPTPEGTSPSLEDASRMRYVYRDMSTTPILFAVCMRVARITVFLLLDRFCHCCLKR